MINNKGFTLVELLAVVVVLGLLLTIAVPATINVTKSASKKALVQIGRLAVQEAEKRYVKDMEEHGDFFADYNGGIFMAYDFNEDLNIGKGKVNGAILFAKWDDGYYNNNEDALRYSYFITYFNKEYFVQKAVDVSDNNSLKTEVSEEDIMKMNSTTKEIGKKFSREFLATAQAHKRCMTSDFYIFNGTYNEEYQRFDLLNEYHAKESNFTNPDGTSKECKEYTNEEILEYVLQSSSKR